MRQLTNHAVQRVIKAMDDGYFTSASFVTSFPEEGDTYFVARFVDNPEFVFTVTKSGAYTPSKAFIVDYTPGQVTSAQHYQTDEFEDWCKSIQKWSANIRNELIASSPVYIEFQQFKTNLNQEIDQRFADSAERFTTEEAAQTRTKLEELTTQMEELHQRNDLTEQELESIKQTLNLLKEDIERIPKKPWFRAAGNKVANLMSRFVNSRPGQKLIQEGTQRLLEGPSE